jgi:tetratricopeptide (TPR) repeat protein
VLHRDLKPANILLDADGRPLVTDFGLARRLDGDSSLTQSGAVVGTPSYAAPEQASGMKGAATTTADVWGLGAVLYAFLTGRPPFRGDTVSETLEQVKGQEPVPPRRLNPRVDRDLDTICLQCLAKDPSRRYASAADLADDLERWQTGEPVWARRAGRWERSRKWLRRNPALAALLVVVALSAGAAVAGLFWHERRLRVEAENAAQERDAAREEQRWAAQAVDDMYTRVAQEWLGPQPRLQPLQREFLEKALEYYQHAAERWPDDPGLREKLPGLYHRVGRIQATLGRQDRAEEALRKAVSGFEELAAASPGDPAVRNDLLRSHNDLGRTLQAMGRLPEAAAVYHRAVELAEKLAGDFPDRPGLRSHPLVAESNLAFALAGGGQAEEAERLYRKALAGLDQLPPSVGRLPDVRSLLANALNNLGNLYLAAGRFADAEPLYRRAAADFERLTTEFPANTDYREQWAFTLSNLGATLDRLDRTSDARPVLTQAESAMERLAGDYPDWPNLSSELAGIQINLGVVLRRLGDAPEAEKFYRKAIKRLLGLRDRFPAVLEHRVRLGSVQVNFGNLLQGAARLVEAEQVRHDAVKTYRELAEQLPGVPRYRASLADSLSRLGETLRRASKFQDANEAWTEALGLQKRLLDAESRNPAYRAAAASTCNSLALLLTWQQAPPYREVGRAVTLALRAVALEQLNGPRWETLGIAQYRAGNWRDCSEAFATAARLKSGKDSHHFFQAIAHWHLGEREEARRHYAVAAHWFGQQASPDPKMLQLRNEAAALLGIGAGPAATNQPMEPR